MEGVRVVGDPLGYAAGYDAQGIDEIVYIDTVASLYRRNHLADLIARSTEQVFCPVTVAGGVRSIEDARELLRAGADKIAVNTAAVRKPELITDLALKFGSQCVVLQIDAKKTANGWEVRTDGGREASGKDAVAWAAEGCERGAGEILLTSIDQEGTGRGADLRLAGAVAGVCSVPVVYSGGVSGVNDCIQLGNIVSGVAMSNVLHYGTAALDDTRAAMDAHGVKVRMAA